MKTICFLLFVSAVLLVSGCTGYGPQESPTPAGAATSPPASQISPEFAEDNIDEAIAALTDIEMLE